MPLPGRGYWAKRRAGQTPPRPPLPEARGPRRVPVSSVLAGTSRDGAKASVPEVQVPAALRRPHELVAAARAALEEARPWNGLASCASKGCLDIIVSKQQRQRALRIMDGLVRYLEANARGVEVTARRAYSYGGEERTFVTEALVGGERVGFALREKLAIHREQPSPRDAARGWPYDQATVTHSPSGTLELSLTSARLHGLRKTWSDGKRQSLEEVLGGFVVGLRRAAAQLAEIHEEDRRRHLARLEAERRRAEEAERRRLEEEKIARLTGEAAAWSRAAELRAYAREALRLLDDQGAASEEAAKRRADLAWLPNHADSINPLTSD